MYIPKMRFPTMALRRGVDQLSRRSMSTVTALPEEFQSSLLGIQGINITTNPYELDRHGREYLDLHLSIHSSYLFP